MKTCKRCEQEKELSEFRSNKRSADGFSYYCKSCYSEMDKDKYLKAKEKGSVASYKQRNKEAIQAYNIEYQKKYRSSGRKQQRKLEMCKYKGGRCNNCCKEANEHNISIFDFHHLDESLKEYTPSDMVNMKWDRIVKELDKCEMLCSNCHRMHHHGTSVLDDITGWEDL